MCWGGFEASDLSVHLEAPIVYTGISETDIVYRQALLPFGIAGRTWCDDSVTTIQCDQHYVEFGSSNPGTKLICHESGHAVGLSHGADANPAQSNGADILGCMQFPLDQTVDGLGGHNITTINQTY